MREVAKVLGDHGMRLGMEYVAPKTSWTARRYPFVHTMAEMKDLLAEIGQINVGFVLDPWHGYTAQETVDDLLTLRGSDVLQCHLNDAPAGVPVNQQFDNRRGLPCSTLVIDMKGFLTAMLKIRYDGPFVCEPFMPELRTRPAADTTSAPRRTAARSAGWRRASRPAPEHIPAWVAKGTVSPPSAGRRFSTFEGKKKRGRPGTRRKGARAKRRRG
jgi:sugar phosphate isomerase/epimerase